MCLGSESILRTLEVVRERVLPIIDLCSKVGHKSNGGLLLNGGDEHLKMHFYKEIISSFYT